MEEVFYNNDSEALEEGAQKADGSLVLRNIPGQTEQGSEQRDLVVGVSIHCWEDELTDI